MFFIFLLEATELGTKNGLPTKLGKQLLILASDDLNRRPLISRGKRLNDQVIYIPLERGDSRDYANIKILSMGCRIGAYGIKQFCEKFSRHN